MEEIPIFLSNMGEKISGVIHVPDRVPAPAVLFCHGFTGDRIETHRLFVRAARRITREGFVAFRFDFRGSGESEGEFEDMTVSSEISDLNVVIDFLKGRREVMEDKIGVIGLSLGGSVSILTAAQNQVIKAVCTWSSPADLKPLSNVRKSLGTGGEEIFEKEYIDLPSGYRVRKTFFMDLLKHDVLAGCAKISPRPLLIIHGSNDTIVPIQHARSLYEKAGEPKKLIIIEGADHTFNRRDWEEEVFEYTFKWFKENLL
ncbi:MAG: alpha/beta hydrolase [Thermoproteota archaeon]